MLDPKNPMLLDRDHPMVKNNPFLQTYLTGMEQWLQATQAVWSPDFQRTQMNMMREATAHALKFWTGGAMDPSSLDGSQNYRGPSDRKR